MDDAKRLLLDDRLARLRAEKLRLSERVKDQTLVLEAYAAARVLSAREYANRVAAVQSRAGEMERRSGQLGDTARVGSLIEKAGGRPGTAAAMPVPADCDGCGFQTSFGSYREGSP